MRLKTEGVSTPLHQKASVGQKGNSQKLTCRMRVSRSTRNGKHSLCSRFTTTIGANPEKLVTAALCSCFSKALINELEISGCDADPFKTTATATLEGSPHDLKVTGILIHVQSKQRRAPHFSDAMKSAMVEAQSFTARLLDAPIDMRTGDLPITTRQFVLLRYDH